MSEPVRITDPSDPRIDVFRSVRDRDLRGRGGLFIAEGVTVLNVLARSRAHRARSVLLSERKLAGLTPLLETLADAEIFVAAQEILDEIAGFHIHRGVLACGERLAEPHAADLLSAATPADIVLVLFGISNHDNMGGLFRSAAAFGAAGVLLDSTCCDPLYRKAIRVSVGAALITPFARLGEGEDALGLLEAHGFAPIALSPAGRTPLHRLARPDRAALLLGAEGPGLPDAILTRAQTVSIPMAGGFDSLNVATAGSIALHHLRFAGAALAGDDEGV